MTSELPSNSVVDKLSRQLFSEIKPICIEISQVALLPNSVFESQTFRLIDLLISLNKSLRNNHEVFIIPNNLADYIFFPISNILKQTQLNDRIIIQVLNIISFLLDKAWKFNFQPMLIDQLYPVILYLSGINNNNTNGNATHSGLDLESKSFDFKRSIIDCITSLIYCIPNTYFSESENSKRLSLLGNTITISLDIMLFEINHSSQEDLILVIDIMKIISELVRYKISSDQACQVFPGLISKTVNFFTLSKNLHFTVLAELFQLLKELIIKTFNDKDLGSQLVKTTISNLESLKQEQEQEQKDQLTIVVNDSNPFRSTSWRNATAKQLQLSLATLFKSLFGSSSNKLKFQTKPQLVLSLKDFTLQVLSNCYISLFDIFLSLSIDIYAWLAGIEDESLNLNFELYAIDLATVCLQDTNSSNSTTITFNQVHNKLSDLINSKMNILLLSSDESKISNYLISLKLHLALFYEISKKLHPDFNQYRSMQLKVLKLLVDTIVDKNKSLDNKKSNMIAPSDNRLNKIELPPHINTNSLTTFNDSTTVQARGSAYASDMQIISSQWNDQSLFLLKEPIKYFKDIYSKTIEDTIIDLIKSFAYYNSKIEKFSHLEFIEQVLAQVSYTDTYESGINLWISNNYVDSLSVHVKHNNIANNLEEYLVISDDEVEENNENENENESLDEIEELSYLVMSKSQDLLNNFTSEDLMTYNINEGNQIQTTYSMALDSIGILSNSLDLISFRTDFLIDYLYPILEALTFQSSPLIQSHAASTINKILENYYNNSFEQLILDNQDYLVDSISLRLRVSNNLSPTLPGILLIIIKVTGLKLLESNQLSDVLTEMFVIIDTYHGYALLVQGFFIIFEALVKQIIVKYIKSEDLQTKPPSTYKPWGIDSIDELIEMFSTSQQNDDSTKYDSQTEYFHRKPDVPFGDQTQDSDDELDSDNEEQEQQQQQQEVEQVWKSPVPQNIYFLAQRIFKYGMLLLTHQSSNLKVQVIKTMRLVFPILVTDYNLTLPLIAELWGQVITLISGSSSLSMFNNSEITPNMEKLISPALEFAIEILNEDYKNGDSFLSKRFIEAWEFLLAKSNGFSLRRNQDSSKDVKDLVLLKRTISPKLSNLYSKFLLTGIRNYERLIPEGIKYNIINTCRVLGIPKDMELSRDSKNILWVLNRS